MKQISNVQRSFSFSGLLFIFVVFTTGCSKENNSTSKGNEDQGARHGLTEKQANEVLYKVGDTQVTVGEFADQIASQPPYLRSRFREASKKKDFLEQLITFELLAEEAKKTGATERPAVQSLKKNLMTDDFKKEKFSQSTKLEDVTEEEIKKFYEENKKDFYKPEQVRISHIQFSKKKAAEKALKELKKSKKQDEVFLKIVETESEDSSSKRRKGDVFYRSLPEEGQTYRGTVPREVIEAAFKVKEDNQILEEVVKSAKAFHIVKRTGFREASTKTLDEVKQSLKYKVWRSKKDAVVEQFQAELRKKYNVKIHDKAIALITSAAVQDKAPKTQKKEK